MGARVGLGLLAHQPSLFDAAVLIGVHPGLTAETDRAERRQVDAGRARLLREEGLEAFVQGWEAIPLFATQRILSCGVLTAQREIRLAHDAEGLARSLEALGLAEMPDHRAALRAAKIPITLITGSLDTKFSQIARALAGESSHVDAQVVEGVGHNVVLEAPQAVAATLKRVEETVRR
jgi:2-succinyl-6-hydroxy-2,4-cyclohexadiene-1-carboxylate synthase